MRDMASVREELMKKETWVAGGREGGHMLWREVVPNGRELVGTLYSGHGSMPVLTHHCS